ncbi:hypothetical protein ACTZWW_06525 [Salinarimonas sp. NSM]|uniref:hypothetical protein n=1 Tax=Salinarimonas sp. NSM TaxID=3458003 RepID=UPI00403609DC
MSLRITERSEAQTRTLGSLLALSANAEAAREALRGAAEDTGAAVDERMHREATSAPIGLRAAKLSRGDLDENDALGAHEPGAPLVETAEAAETTDAKPANPEMGLEELMRVNLHAAEVIDRLGGGPGEA